MSALTPTRAELQRSIRLLKRALELCGTPERWTQQVYARCPHGREMAPTSPHAARFCLVGALMRAAEEQRLRRRVSLAIQDEPLADFNGVPLTPALDLALAACSFVIYEDCARGLQVDEPGFPFAEWLRARQHDPDPESHLGDGLQLDFANDHPDTGHEQVVAGITAAIGVLESELKSRTPRRTTQGRGVEQS
jgi:hypothetical protein